MVDLVLQGLQSKDSICYIDDIVVFSQTFDQHLKDLGEVFSHVSHDTYGSMAITGGFAHPMSDLHGFSAQQGFPEPQGFPVRQRCPERSLPGHRVRRGEGGAQCT